MRFSLRASNPAPRRSLREHKAAAPPRRRPGASSAASHLQPPRRRARPRPPEWRDPKAGRPPAALALSGGGGGGCGSFSKVLPRPELGAPPPSPDPRPLASPRWRARMQHCACAVRRRQAGRKGGGEAVRVGGRLRAPREAPNQMKANSDGAQPKENSNAVKSRDSKKITISVRGEGKGVSADFAPPAVAVARPFPRSRG